MNFKTGLSAALAWLRVTRCKCLLVMTILCLGLRENYPFSNFPMYSSFSSRTYYLYLTGADGQSLRTREFGLSTSGLKKIFDHYRRIELRRFERSREERVSLAEQSAGNSLLQYLDGLSQGRPRAKKLLAGMTVQHVRVWQDEHNVVLQTHKLATHR